MRKLPKEFYGKGEVDGWKFRQVDASDCAYVYEAINLETDMVTHYEVFEHRYNERFDCISYPKSNSFGVWAFTAVSYPHAIDIFVNINEKICKKEIE